MDALLCILAAVLFLSFAYADERKLAAVASIGNSETHGFVPTAMGTVGDGGILPEGVPISLVGPGGNGFSAGFGGSPDVGGNGIITGIGGSRSVVASDLDFNGNGILGFSDADLPMIIGGDSVDFNAFSPAGNSFSGAAAMGISGISGFDSVITGTGGGTMNVGDNIGRFGLGGNSEIFDSGTGGGFINVGENIGRFGLSGNSEILGSGTGGVLMNVGENVGRFGLSVNGASLGSNLMATPGSTGLSSGGISLGSPVSIDRLSDGIIGLQGAGQLVRNTPDSVFGFGGGLGASSFTDVGRLPGLGSINPFSSQFGTQPGPRNTNAWSFRVTEQVTGQLPGFDVRSGATRFGSTMGQPAIRVPGVMPVNDVLGGIQSVSQLPVQGMGMVNSIQTDSSVGSRFVGGFASQNLGPHNNDFPDTIVIRDADTAVVNTGPAATGSMRILVPRTPQATFRHTPVPVSQLPMISGWMQGRLPFRAMRPRFMPAGEPTLSPIFRPARIPFRRPRLHSLRPRGSLAGRVRPFPNSWSRMGLSTSSRVRPFKSSFRLGGAMSSFQDRVSPKTARMPTASIFGRLGLVPGSKGYSQYYRSKYMHRKPVTRRRFIFPRRRIYRRKGHIRRRITVARAARRMY